MLKYFFTLSILSSIFVGCNSGGVETIKPIRKDITELVFASGVLVADSLYNLTAQTEGYLTKMQFTEGDLVKSGQVMAIVDNSQNLINASGANQLYEIAKDNAESDAPALQVIKANLKAAKEKLAQDKIQAERYRQLYSTNSVSRLENENAKLALSLSQANVDALESQLAVQQSNANQSEIAQRNNSQVSNVTKQQNQVCALSNAKVYEKRKQLGDYVRRGDVIAVLGTPSTIYAMVNVDEASMNKVKENQIVFIRLNTNKERIYKARVAQILPKFDESSLSYLVKVYFTDSLDFKIIGTQLEANILVGERKNVLVIPRSYLDYGNEVMLKHGNKKVKVKTGLVSNEYVEILDGLTEKDELTINTKK